MTQELLLVGSIPLETAEEVFRVFGGALGVWLPYIPDGEIGERPWARAEQVNASRAGASTAPSRS